MLNNEVKEILQEQFSKEENYKKIIKNVNREQKKYNKILKIALLPTCAVLLATIIIPNICNKSVDFAKTNISENNTAIEQDNQIQVSKRMIYKTIEGGESCWAYDPTIPTNLINDHSETKYIIKVKISSICEGEMLPKQENFYDPYTCYTPIKMQIIDNFSDTNKLSGTITAYITGGKIKISNLLETVKYEDAKSLGILNLSIEDQKKYIEYIGTTPYYEPTIGDEYIIIINKTNENLYQVMCDGYGIFRIDKSNNQEKYINVITGKEWRIQ